MNKYKKIRVSKDFVIDEHRLKMQNFLGRKLDFNEIVHHKDGNKLNNNLSNLEILSRSEHMRMHIKNGDIKSPGPNSEKLCARFSKLTEEQVIEVINSNEKGSVLSKKFNVSKFVLSRLRCKKTWKHINK